MCCKGPTTGSELKLIDAGGTLPEQGSLAPEEFVDEPPLVYLVAPTLMVHPSFNILAKCIAGDVEIYKFEINEDWRSGVRVMRRSRVN